MSDAARAQFVPSSLESSLGLASIGTLLGCALSAALGCVSTPSDLFHQIDAPEAAVDTPAATSLGNAPVAAPNAPAGGGTPAPAGATPSAQLVAPSAATQGGPAAPGSGNGSATPGSATDDGAADDSAHAPPESPPAPPAPAPPRNCPALTQSMLLDFGANPSVDPTQAIFGDFATTLSGGTFVYPALPEAFALSSEVASGEWHIAGAVGAVSGFGLFFDCDQIDASGFDGLSFRISGDVARDGEVTLLVGTASDQVSSGWLIASGTDPAAPSNFGRCTPAKNPFDGSCNTPRVTVPVRRGQRRIDVRFSDLGEGSPSAGVNPAEITSIAWALPAPATLADGSAEPYDIDLRIDDIRFLGR